MENWENDLINKIEDLLKTDNETVGTLEKKNKELKEELAQVKANHRLLFITLLIVTVINSIGIILRIIQ